jgi:sulfofructose kinase
MEELPLWPGPRPDAACDVVGIGEISADHVCVVDAFPATGAEIALDDYAFLPGGQVASAVRGCARLGLRASLVGSVGDDPSGEATLAPLARDGVDVSGVARIAGARTRLAVVLVERASGERTVLGYRDPRLRLEPARLDAGRIRRARVLHLDVRDPEAALWAARVARRAGIPVVLDAQAVWPGAGELLELVDFPIVSRRFAEEWGETGAVRDGLRALARCGSHCRLAVVTLGELGAIAGAGERGFESPAYAVEVRDTTGAGDAFRAGFIWGLLQGLPAEAVVGAANAVAGLNCEALGAQGGLPSRARLEDFLRSHRPRAWREP